MLDYFNSLTSSPTASFFAAIAVAFLLYVLMCVIWQKGICPLPSIMLMGFWGIAVCPWLMLVAIEYRHHAGLLAHERWHQGQQRKDGVLRYWWRYHTSKQARQDYEVAAYREWVQVAPKDLHRCVWYLTKSYEFDLTDAEATALLTA